MYRVSPFTYLLEALIGYGLGRQEVHCSPVEFLTINPPAGQTCGDYLGPYMSSRGGYLQDLNATTACQLCSARTTDDMLGGVYNLFYENHWRDFGVVMVFVVFNVSRSVAHSLMCETQASADCLYLLVYISACAPEVKNGVPSSRQRHRLHQVASLHNFRMPYFCTA